MKICSLAMYMVPNLFNSSDSARHRSQDICLIVVIQLGTGLRTFAHFLKFSLFIKECPEEIWIKLTISKSSRDTE